ncbi:MAG: hypothetical protein ACOCWW_00685 [Bacteroidota bacterium]
MSRTYRNPNSRKKLFKIPSGRKKAIINKARKKSIPPDDRDDKVKADENFKIAKYVRRLKNKQVPIDKAIMKTAKKFNISAQEAEDEVSDFYKM